MYIETEPKTIHMMSDGNILDDDGLKMMAETASLMGSIPQEPVKSRTVQVKTVKWCKMTSIEILDRQDMLGTFIPVVKVIGEELIMPDGKIRLSGLIERAMDAQRLHNFSIAGFIEHVALAPRAPWVAPAEAISGYENDYSDANRKNIAVLPFNHLGSDGNPLPVPQRTPPAGIAPGWQQMLQNTEHGIEASMGMYGPTVGAKSQEKSGIALQEQKTQGAVGNYHFPDNLARSIQHTGRILVQWIPKVYDTTRIARILGEDGEQDTAHLNPDQPTASAPMLDEFNQEVGTIYNLGVGKYDVTISTGPSYTAKRQEAAENQMQLIQARPDIFSLVGDILLNNMDWPGADKMADRIKAMLPPPIQQLEQQNGKKPIPPEVQAAMQQVQQAAEAIQKEHQNIDMRNQELQQKSQELQKMQMQMETMASGTREDKAALDSIKGDIAANQRILQADRLRLRAELELIGRKILDDVEARLEGQLPQEVVNAVEQIVQLAKDEVDGPHITDLPN
jgi:hypothetical protein